MIGDQSSVNFLDSPRKLEKFNLPAEKFYLTLAKLRHKLSPEGHSFWALGDVNFAELVSALGKWAGE